MHAALLTRVAILALVPGVLTAQFPGDRWTTARPAEVGVNTAALDSIDREIRAGQYIEEYMHGETVQGRRTLTAQVGTRSFTRPHNRTFACFLSSLFSRCSSSLRQHPAIG